MLAATGVDIGKSDQQREDCTSDGPAFVNATHSVRPPEGIVILTYHAARYFGTITSGRGSLERFQAKWTPVRVKKTRQIKI